MAGRIISHVRKPPSLSDSELSPKEREVLNLIARGNTNKAAAAALFISEATVKTHLLHIYAKLGVNDRAAAMSIGYDRGLLSTVEQAD